MKQYTSKDQTAKLTELGFPKPQSIESIDIEFDGAFDEHTIYNMRYSIGELIEFLTSSNLYYPVIDLSKMEGELIDSLYEVCLTLKDEGVI